MSEEVELEVEKEPKPEDIDVVSLGYQLIEEAR